MTVIRSPISPVIFSPLRAPTALYKGGGGIRDLPATIGSATLAADWRADLETFEDASGTVPASSTDLIYTWTDQVADLLAQEATSSERPILYADAASRKIVRLRGQAGSRLTAAYDAAFQPGTGAFHVFVVARNLSDNLSALVTFGNSTSTTEGWSIFIENGLLIMRCHDGTNRASRSLNIGANCMVGDVLLHLELTGSAIKGRVNGSETGFVDGGGGPTAATYSLSINNTDALIIGANPLVTEPAAADFKRIAIYKGALTTNEVATISNQLMTDHRVQSFSATPAAIENLSSVVSVFANGGTDYYRIPAIVAGATAVLAAIEHRYGDADDHGHIEVEVKRSTDNGATWGSAVVLGEDGTNCVQNPLLIRNTDTGRIHLLYVRMDEAATEATVRAGTYAQTVFHRYTDDEGSNWSSETDITSQVKPNAAWRAFYTGPGTGVYHAATGRVMGPVWIGTTALAGDDQFVTIYSDDDGDTWEVSGPHGIAGSNETTFGVGANGDIIAISRNQGAVLSNYGMRNVSFDAGVTFTENQPDAGLFGFPTKSALLAFDDGRLLHSRIAATSRVNLQVFLSADGGATWPKKSRVITGASAYSSMCVLPNGKVGILYEKNTDGTIAFATFDPVAA